MVSENASFSLGMYASYVFYLYKMYVPFMAVQSKVSESFQTGAASHTPPALIGWKFQGICQTEGHHVSPLLNDCDSDRAYCMAVVWREWIF